MKEKEIVSNRAPKATENIHHLDLETLPEMLLWSPLIPIYKMKEHTFTYFSISQYYITNHYNKLKEHVRVLHTFLKHGLCIQIYLGCCIWKM